MRCHVSDVEIRAAGDRGRREQQGGCQCENNKHREKPRIESADESPRTARLKCIRLVAEPSVSARWRRSLQQLSRNSADRYPFPSENHDRLSKAGRMQKKSKKKGEKRKEIKRKEGGIRQRKRSRATVGRAKEAIPTVTRNGDT